MNSLFFVARKRPFKQLQKIKRELASICLTSRRSLVKPREPKTRFRNGKFSYYLAFSYCRKRISLALALHLHLPFNTTAGYKSPIFVA